MKQILSVMGFLAPIVFLLVACGGTNGTSTSSATTSEAPSVHITETDFHIASSVTDFVPGRRYHFVITNQGQTAHEFMIMPKSEGAMNGMTMGDMDRMALAMIETINPSEAKTLDYTFPSSAAGSHPELACYFPGHYEAGMKLGVSVKS